MPKNIKGCLGHREGDENWSEFKHANIVKFEGYIMEGRYPALVSEWMKRGSLWQYMKNPT